MKSWSWSVEGHCLIVRREDCSCQSNAAADHVSSAKNSLRPHQSRNNAGMCLEGTRNIVKNYGSRVIHEHYGSLSADFCEAYNESY